MKTALAGRGAGLSEETARDFVNGEPGIPGLWEAWAAQDACRAVMREKGRAWGYPDGEYTKLLESECGTQEGAAQIRAKNIFWESRAKPLRGGRRGSR